ncbi:FAD-binding oxidoreductase [Nitriliruptor alkaliphilus]|uniref:FAD-binding oxidoreductase n=1 Tax=Nitriliruptor alkaliphilus TaxID=427918 RepID=UPI00069912A7|nr:FAD-binding oxidoreductase [Nitriliruptor alkaliphilus]
MPLSTALLDDLADVTGLDVVTDPHVTGPYAHDWWPRMLMRRRAGEDLPAPDAVVAPRSRDEVVDVVAWCAANQVALVPFGAGTGVCGGANPVAGALTVDLKLLTGIGPLDEVSGVIEVEPGVIAQRLEDHLVHRGWTLGHHPSSAHASTIGGFLAVRSAGQASALHGKLEDTVVGLEVVLADGQVFTSRPVPQTSSGPDLTRLFLGGEGTTGIITRAWLRVRPVAETTLDRGWLVGDVGAGLEAMRAIVRTGTMPAVLRLYDEPDTAVVFGGQGLPVPEGCLLVVGCEGRADVAAFTEQVASGELTRLGAEDLGRGPGEHWRAHRHGMSYRFAEYVKPGGTFGDALTLDTMEVAGLWRDLPDLYVAVRDALQAHVDLVLAHVSHVYDTGASIYFTLGAVNEGDEVQALARYDAAWEAGQRAALAVGATASHHHGIGLLRAPYLPEELGPAGFDVLRRVKDALDPGHLLNPGKLGLGGPA